MTQSEQFERELHETLHLLRWLRSIIVLFGVLFAGMLLFLLFGLVASFWDSGTSGGIAGPGVHPPLLNGISEKQRDGDVRVTIHEVQRTAETITVVAEVDGVDDAADPARWRWMLDRNAAASANAEPLADGSIRLTYAGSRQGLRWLHFDAPGGNGPDGDFYFGVGGK